MNLTVVRKTFTEKSTIGDLLVNGTFQCYTLEDKVRAEKIAHITAIPYGMYEVVVTFSNRFQKQLPLLLNVPGFDGIRIHPGNSDEDTEGCILVGETKTIDFIGNSRAAFSKLFAIINAALKKERVWIEIKREG